MKRLVRQTLQLILSIGLFAGVVLASSDSLWARSNRFEEKPLKEPSFATGYLVVVILVGVGLAVICRPNLRGGDGEDDG